MTVADAAMTNVVFAEARYLSYNGNSNLGYAGIAGLSFPISSYPNTTIW